MKKSSKIKILIAFVVFLLLLIFFFINKKQKIVKIGPESKLSEYLSLIQEGSRPGSCLVLEEKYCDQGLKLDYNDHFYAMGFKVPKNTKVFSPIDGALSEEHTIIFKDNENTYSYPAVGIDLSARVNSDALPPGYFLIVLGKGFKPINKRNIQKGEEVALTNSQKIDYYGDYNLLVYFSKEENRRYIVDEEKTLNLFNQ